MAYPTYEDHLLDALGYADQGCPDAALFETVKALELLLKEDVVQLTLSESETRKALSAMDTFAHTAMRVLNRDAEGGI